MLVLLNLDLEYILFNGCLRIQFNIMKYMSVILCFIIYKVLFFCKFLFVQLLKCNYVYYFFIFLFYVLFIVRNI